MKKNSSERALFLYASHNGTVILSTPAVFATTVQRYQETTLNNQGIFNQRKGVRESVSSNRQDHNKGYFKTFNMGCLSNKIANILFWLLQFIYYTQVATESIFVTKHQTKIWESLEEEERWVRENTLCALLQVHNPAFQGQLFLGNNLGAAEARSALSSLPPTWTTKALPPSWPSAREDSLVGWRRQRCGKPNANVEI